MRSFVSMLFSAIFVILLLFPLHFKCQDSSEATTEKEEDTSKDNSTSDISCHFVDNQNNTLICQSLLVTELDLKFIPKKLKTLCVLSRSLDQSHFTTIA